MFDRIRRLLVGNVQAPEHPELDERERQIDATLARVSGRTHADIEREVRRRALRLEVESMRRK